MEAGVAARQVGGDGLGHLVTRRHQAVDHAAVQRHLADGVDGRVGGLQQVVDRHAAALADVDAAGARQVVARADAGGDDNHVHLQLVSVLEAHAGHAAVAQHLLGRLVQMHAHAEVFDLAHQHPRAGVVDLPRHQARSEFNHVRFQPQVVGRLGRFEAEQAAANNGSPFHPVAVVDNSLQVLDGAVDEHAALFDARHRRHERERPGSQHHRVVAHLDVPVGAHHLGPAVDVAGAVADVQFDAVGLVPGHFGHHEFLRVAVGEKRGKADAVIRRTRLLAEGDQPELPVCVALDELLAETLSDHAVADDDNVAASVVCVARFHDSPPHGNSPERQPVPVVLAGYAFPGAKEGNTHGKTGCEGRGAAGAQRPAWLRTRPTLPGSGPPHAAPGPRRRRLFPLPPLGARSARTMSGWKPPPRRCRG